MEDPWSRMMVSSEQAQLMANLIRLINGTKAIEIGEMRHVYKRQNVLQMSRFFGGRGGWLSDRLRYLDSTGMYTGYNALSMALSMPESGRVVACETEVTYIDIAKPFFGEVRSLRSINIHSQHEDVVERNTVHRWSHLSLRWCFTLNGPTSTALFRHTFIQKQV